MNDCADFKKIIGSNKDCCISCHDDWEYGYDEPMEEEIDGVVYFICCAHRIVYEENNDK